MGLRFFEFRVWSGFGRVKSSGAWFCHSFVGTHLERAAHQIFKTKQFQHHWRARFHPHTQHSHLALSNPIHVLVWTHPHLWIIHTPQSSFRCCPLWGYLDLGKWLILNGVPVIVHLLYPIQVQQLSIYVALCQLSTQHLLLPRLNSKKIYSLEDWYLAIFQICRQRNSLHSLYRFGEDNGH